MPPTLARAARRLAQTPLKTMLFAIIVSYVVVRNPPLTVGWGLDRDAMKKAEFYPFSSFPMYSRFSPNPNYVYLSDAEGRPLAAQGEFGALSSELKKFYDARLREIHAASGVSLSRMSVEEKRPAGEATLRHVVASAPDQARVRGHDRLRLHEVIIRFDDEDRIVRDDLVIAEIAPGPAATP